MTISRDAAISGMVEQQRNIALIANNLANVNTTAYKAVDIHFQDVLDTLTVIEALTGELPPDEEPTLSAGVESVDVQRDFAQGPLQPTQRQLDFSITGPGFFRVRLENDSVAYTRDGMFRIDGAGNLVTGDGDPLDPPITLPAGFQALQISSDGELSVLRPYTAAELAALPPDSPTDGVREVVDTLQLTRFPNPEGLDSIGNNLFIETEESQAPIDGPPGEDGMGEVVSGFLEASNVSVAEEMSSLVIAMRAYQLNMNAFRTIEQMLADANQLAA
jgi:flagellar basal-body rod protein FlgG